MARKNIALAIISLLMLFSMSCATNQGTAAPSFTLSDMAGRQVSLADYEGQKAVLLLFFNPKTGGGQDSLLRGYLDYYKQSDKLQIIPIVNISELGAAGGSTADGPQKRLTDLGYPVPLRDDDGSVSQTFSANPDKLTLVLVDWDGNIRFRQEVTSTADTNTELAQQVEKLTK